MNSKFVLVAALAAGALTPAAFAQTPAEKPAVAPAPQAIPAKIAFIELTQVAAATHEGQNAIDAIKRKFEPTRQKLNAEKEEIDTLTKQLQSAPASMTDEERAERARSIDTKQKQYQLDSDDASTSYSTDVQAAIGKILGRLGPVVVKYVQQNGYTMLLDNTGQPQQGGLNLLWGGTDISQAVVEAFDAAYPAAAAMPSAPSAHPRTTPRPSSPRK